MAYGDNRTSVATDTFDSSIDANWTNGDGGLWTDLAWATGGFVEPAATGSEAAMRRSGESYSGDQYSKVTLGVEPQTSGFVGVQARKQAADNGCYEAYTQRAGTSSLQVFYVSNASGFTDLGSATVGEVLTTGDSVTIEVEGQTIRAGCNDGTDGDVEIVTNTNASLASGSPGIYVFDSTDVARSRVTSWEGGNISGTKPMFRGQA